jgi:hypothetical protein
MMTDPLLYWRDLEVIASAWANLADPSALTRFFGMLSRSDQADRPRSNLQFITTSVPASASDLFNVEPVL